MALKKSERKALVDNLITNCSCGEVTPWSEDDRETLDGMTDETLVSLNEHARAATLSELVANAALEHGEFDMEQGTYTYNAAPPFARKKSPGGGCGQAQGAHGGAPAETEEETEDTSEESEDYEEEEEEAPAMNQRKQTVNSRQPQGRKMSDKEWMDNAPVSVRRMVANAAKREAQQREQLIEIITANENNVLDEATLSNMNVEQLAGIAELALDRSPRRANFAGASAPTGNARGSSESLDDDDDVLPLPTINWEAWAKGNRKQG